MRLAALFHTLQVWHRNVGLTSVRFLNNKCETFLYPGIKAGFRAMITQGLDQCEKQFYCFLASHIRIIKKIKNMGKRAIIRFGEMQPKKHISKFPLI